MRVPQPLVKFWRGWQRVVRAIAHALGIIVLTVMYVVVFAPVWLIFRIFKQDPLAVTRPPAYENKILRTTKRDYEHTF